MLGSVGLSVWEPLGPVGLGVGDRLGLVRLGVGDTDGPVGDGIDDKLSRVGAVFRVCLINNSKTTQKQLKNKQHTRSSRRWCWLVSSTL